MQPYQDLSVPVCAWRNVCHATQQQHVHQARQQVDLQSTNPAGMQMYSQHLGCID